MGLSLLSHGVIERNWLATPVISNQYNQLIMTLSHDCSVLRSTHAELCICRFVYFWNCINYIIYIYKQQVKYMVKLYIAFFQKIS